MTLGLLWMGVANAAVLLAARATLRRMSLGRPSADLVLFFVLRILFISGLVMGAGLAGTLTPAGVGIPCLLALAVLLARGERFEFPARTPIPRELPGYLLVIAGALVVRGLLQTWFYAPIDGDATSYHLPKIAEWVRTGGFAIDYGTDFRSWFPAGFELVEAWWVLFLHNDVLIEIAGLEFLFLASACAWALARWLGTTLSSALLAALVVATVPGLSTQSVNCLNDTPAAALVLSAAVLVVSRAPFLLLVMLGGMAAGLKPTTVYALPGLLLLLLLSRKEPATLPRARALLGTLAVLGAAVGAYWYLRNWAVKGSPVYPVGSPDNVDPVQGMSLQRLGPSLGSLTTNLKDLADHRIYDGRRSYHPLLEYSAGWGIVVVACGLPALVAALRWNPRLRALAAAFALSLVSVLGQVVNDPFYMRFILWFPVLPALALACVVDRAPPLRFPALASLLIAVFSTTCPSTYPWAGLVARARGDFLTEGATFLSSIKPEYPKVGVYGKFPRSYMFYGGDYGREVVSVRATSPEELESEMVNRNLKLLYTINLPPPSREGRIVDECVRRRWLIRLNPSVLALPR